MPRCSGSNSLDLVATVDRPTGCATSGPQEQAEREQVLCAEKAKRGRRLKEVHGEGVVLGEDSRVPLEIVGGRTSDIHPDTKAFIANELDNVKNGNRLDSLPSGLTHITGLLTRDFSS